MIINDLQCDKKIITVLKNCKTMNNLARDTKPPEPVWTLPSWAKLPHQPLMHLPTERSKSPPGQGPQKLKQTLLKLTQHTQKHYMLKSSVP